MKLKKILACVLASVFCFGALGFSACGDTSDLTVYMPDGAPALAFAKLMHEDTEDDGFTYKVVNPTLIKTKVTYEDESKNADLCVLPLTAATKLLGSGERYQMVGAVTHGNLYLISKNTDTMYASNNLPDLCGKTVGVLQLNEVPGLIFKTVLSKAGIVYQENGEPSADKVNLVPITASDVGALENVDLYLLAEPAVSAKKSSGFEIVGDVQVLYGGENGYPQAVLVAKRSVIEKRWSKVVDIISVLQVTSAWLSATDGATIVAAVTSHLEDDTYSTTLKAPLLSSAVLGRCGVWYQGSQSAKQDVQAFITAAQAVNANMATMPSDAFFHNPSVEA